MDWSWTQHDVIPPPIDTANECSFCKHTVRLSDEGFLTCINPSCGAIIIQSIDRTPEWNSFGEDVFTSNPIRCGMPINPLLEESSLGCKILCGRKTSIEMRRIARVADWHSMPYKEKTRWDDFQFIERMSTNACIPKMIVNEAFWYYKLISERQSFRGLNRDGIIAASVYIACRIQKFPRTAKEIAKIFQLDATSATRGCKNAMAIMNEIEKEIPSNEQTVYSNTSPLSFIERYCSGLNISSEFTKLAQFIAIQIEKKNLIPENTPHSIAAGIIYVLSQEFNLNISQKDIQVISDTSEVTITKCYRKIEAMKHLVIPKGIYEKYKLS